MDWLPGGPDVVGSFEDLPLRWYLRTEEREVRIGTVFGEVEMVTTPAVPGQTGLLTGLLTRRQLEEKLSGFTALTCLPILE
jgi:hypothetical protein